MSANSELAGVLRGALHLAHWVLEGTMADVTQELADRQPAGRANSVGSCYMHVLLSEDRLINRPKVRDQQPLFATTWSGKTGADRLEPEPGTGDLGAWYRTVRVDLPQARGYGAAVFQMSEEFVGSLSDAELRRELEIGPLGKSSLASWIEMFLTGHANSLAGEISAVKGTFGLKGYPF